jgi:hypothetical protein
MNKAYDPLNNPAGQSHAPLVRKEDHIMMKNLIFALLILHIPSIALAKQYYITPDVTMVGKSITVSGKTNLPDGSYISIAIVGLSASFIAQGHTEVVKGFFKSEGYGPDNGFKDGSYEAEIMASDPKNKSVESIKKFSIVSGKIGKFSQKSVSDAKKTTRAFANKLTKN